MQASSQDPSWDDVRLFLAAFRDKTLGAAARRLRLDTSTLSRRLSAFESDLGVRLFDRSREGLVATRAGQQLLPAAEAMEAAHARLTRDASDVESTAEGIVRLSVAPTFAEQFVVPLLPKLNAAFPRICIELDVSTRPLDLSRYEADLALRAVPPVGATLLITKLGNSRWRACASPGLVKKLGSLRTWKDARWIAWDRDMAGYPAAQWLQKHVGDASVVFRTSAFSAQLIAAQTGLGVVLVPDIHAKAAKLVPVRFGKALKASTEEWPGDDLWLVTPKALREVPRVAAVWGFLRESLLR